MRLFACLATAFAAAVLAVGATRAQAAVQADTLRQSSESSGGERRAPLTDRVSRAPVPPGAELTRLSRGSVRTIRAFRFVGNSRIPEAGLQAIVRPWVGRELGFADLHRASQAVAGAYRDRGWAARAFLPDQDFSDGIVTIRLVETGSGPEPTGFRYEQGASPGAT